METLIVICLLLVIFLLLEDKFVIKKRYHRKENQKKTEIILPEIMGLPKSVTRLSVPKSATASQYTKQEEALDNFEPKIKKKHFDQQIPQEELDEVFGEGPDLLEEEEEWSRYGVADDEDGFATGVTFEELGTVGMVLRQETLEPSLQQQAVATVRKIEGTELFSLLQNSMEGASRKIAELLDRSLSAETTSGSSTMRNSNLDDFDIGEFV